MNGYSLWIHVEQYLDPSTVREMASILLADRKSSPSPTVGKIWSSTFVQLREELCIRYSRYYDYQRTQNEDPKFLNQWFETVQCVIDISRISSQRISIILIKPALQWILLQLLKYLYGLNTIVVEQFYNLEILNG